MNTSTPDTTHTVYWSLGLHPVQSWIAEARRSRDLRAGSRLLAVLMGDLLTELDKADAGFLLPQIEPEDLASLRGSLKEAMASGTTAVSNRASGTLSVSLDEAKKLLASLEQRLHQRWDTAVGEVRQAAQRQAQDLWKLVGVQIGEPTCPFRLVWVVAEAEGSTTPREGLEMIDELYDAAKRSRPVPVHEGAAVRKCGQCGRREAMGGPDREEWWKFQDRLRREPAVQYGLRIGLDEFLCPVCALRRFAGYLGRNPFPSTSAIAAADWWRALRRDTTLADAANKLEAAIRRVPGYQESWADLAPLYFERTARREHQQAGELDDRERREALGRVLAAQEVLARAIQSWNRAHPSAPKLPAQPSEYLAVIFFDGDDLGRKLRKNLDSLPGQIRDFQDRLAAEVEGDGDLARATPFYLGGDEGLLLCPVGSSLKVLGAVRSLWREVIGSDRGDPTLSAGAAIFDRERPLGPALEIARAALRAAKDVPHKNSLSVQVQTASGSVWAATGRWDTEWPGLARAVEMIDHGTLASRWPYAVGGLLREVTLEALTSGGESRRALRQEVRRLTGRHVLKNGGGEPGTDRGKAAWDELEAEDWWQEQPPEEVLATLPGQFHLVAFLARHGGGAE